ncbi:MAG: hypothetical protein MUP98_00515 [Candidatus Aminicenantes bacterium]|nr:hypothetical protein [Candidatus Aminicenantes bacterium]
MLIVLLDADVIIDLHRFGIWEKILKKNKILIPSTILRHEVFYFVDTAGIKHYIDLIDDAGNAFTEVSATAEDLIQFKQKFDRFIEEELDPGETEALKILLDRNDCYFCTCDKVAIKTMALLGKREQALSFEKLLKSSGFTKSLELKHTENYFKKYLDEGSILRIQRFGLKKNGAE